VDSNIVKDELQKSLAADLALYTAGPYQCGLFTNDLDDTDRDHSIGDITPCAGAGYDGLRDLDDWGALAWVSPAWESDHAPVVWTFDGSATRTIRGVYVVDDLGALAAWRKFAGAGITVGFFAGQTFTAFITRTRASSP
jgi:hypothetical protein